MKTWNYRDVRTIRKQQEREKQEEIYRARGEAVRLEWANRREVIGPYGGDRNFIPPDPRFAGCSAHDLDYEKRTGSKLEYKDNKASQLEPKNSETLATEMGSVCLQ